jgi:hypothetical protein
VSEEYIYWKEDIVARCWREKESVKSAIGARIAPYARARLSIPGAVQK